MFFFLSKFASIYFGLSYPSPIDAHYSVVKVQPPSSVNRKGATEVKSQEGEDIKPFQVCFNLRYLITMVVMNFCPCRKMQSSLVPIPRV